MSLHVPYPPPPSCHVRHSAPPPAVPRHSVLVCCAAAVVPHVLRGQMMARRMSCGAVRALLSLLISPGERAARPNNLATPQCAATRPGFYSNF